MRFFVSSGCGITTTSRCTVVPTAPYRERVAHRAAFAGGALDFPPGFGRRLLPLPKR